MEFLAILSSMAFESAMVLDSFKNIRKTNIAKKAVYKGRVSGANAVLINTGIGKVNAAHSVTCIIEHFPVKCVINMGVGGAYPGSGLKKGDIAVAIKEVCGDEGVITEEGWKGIRETGIPLLQTGRKKYFNEFPLDKDLVKKALNSAKHLTQINPAPEKPRYGMKSGTFVTAQSTTGTYERAVELQRRFNAICENMEGAAVAHVCAAYKIPVLEIRGISNTAGERDRRKWDLKLASENCQEAVLKGIRVIQPCR